MEPRPDPTSALVVLNPVSGGAAPDEVESALRAALGDRGVALEIVPTPRTETADALVEAIEAAIVRAVEGGVDLVVAVGGDGTVGMVADAMVRSGAADRAVLGIVPRGTGNILARELGIPLGVDAAVALLAEGGTARWLDAMRVGGRHYFTQLGVGLDARMIAATEREAQIAHGRVAYVAAFLQSAVNLGVARYACRVDGMELRLRAFQVVVANCATLGSAPFAWGPGILPDDGALDLCVYNTRRFLDPFVVAWKVLTNNHSRDALTRYYRATERVVVRSRPVMDVQADGEIIGRTPVTIELVAGALRVRVPEPSEETARGAPDADPAADPAAVPEPVASPAVDPPRGARRRTLVDVLVRRVHTLASLDAALFLAVNGWRHGALADRAAAAVSRTMLHGELWAAVMLAAAALDPERRRWLLLVALPGMGLATLAVNYAIKPVFRRRRPFHDLVAAVVVGRRPDDASFPSGHTAAAFAGAWLLAAAYPAAAPALFAVAALVGLTRVYLGVHYPTDVLLGGLTGVALAIACRAGLEALSGPL